MTCRIEENGTTLGEITKKLRMSGAYRNGLSNCRRNVVNNEQTLSIIKVKYDIKESIEIISRNMFEELKYVLIKSLNKCQSL